jgi:hypothetical protein
VWTHIETPYQATQATVNGGINDNQFVTPLTLKMSTQWDGVVLLAGRSGGQTVIGGTGVGENLTLMSNGSGTKGNINFGNSRYDEVNNRWYFGSATGVGRINLPDAGTTAADGIQFGTGTSNLYRSVANTLRTDGILSVGSSGVFAGGGHQLLTTGYLLSPSTLTGSQSTSALSISQTWNTTGSPTAIDLNVTDTASNAASLFMSLRSGVNNVFNVRKRVLTYIDTPSGVSVQSNTSGSGLITALALTPADPTSGISNGANFGFNGSSVNFYGMGVASLRSSLYDIWFQTGAANGGGFRFYKGTTEIATISSTGAVSSLYQRFGSGSPEGVVAAPIGAFYSRTDGGAGTSFYVKESGGSTSSGWVAK